MVAVDDVVFDVCVGRGGGGGSRVDHFWTGVDADDRSAAACEYLGQDAVAAPQVKDALARLRVQGVQNG